MTETISALARLAQYAGLSGLLGAALFLLYGARSDELRRSDWTVRLVGASGGVLIAGAAASVVVQTAQMAGELAAALDPAALGDVLTGTEFGRAMTLRIAFAAAALLALFVVPRRARWVAVAALATCAAITFAWTGHAASAEGWLGWIHRASDTVHVVAAAAWIGALTCLAALVFYAHRSGAREDAFTAQRALAGFSGAGSLIVAALVATGLINTWSIVGFAQITALPAAGYGQVLFLKLALFAAMLGLAALNRWVLTPAADRLLAGGEGERHLGALRTSVAIETLTALALLLSVSVLGTLMPPGAEG